MIPLGIIIIIISIIMASEQSNAWWLIISLFGAIMVYFGDEAKKQEESKKRHNQNFYSFNSDPIVNTDELFTLFMFIRIKSEKIVEYNKTKQFIRILEIEYYDLIQTCRKLINIANSSKSLNASGYKVMGERYLRLFWLFQKQQDEFVVSNNIFMSYYKKIDMDINILSLMSK